MKTKFLFKVLKKINMHYDIIPFINNNALYITLGGRTAPGTRR